MTAAGCIVEPCRPLHIKCTHLLHFEHGNAYVRITMNEHRYNSGYNCSNPKCTFTYQTKFFTMSAKNMVMVCLAVYLVRWFKMWDRILYSCATNDFSSPVSGRVPARRRVIQRAGASPYAFTMSAKVNTPVLVYVLRYLQVTVYLIHELWRLVCRENGVQYMYNLIAVQVQRNSEMFIDYEFSRAEIIIYTFWSCFVAVRFVFFLDMKQ